MMTTSPYHWCITWFTFTAHWRSTKLSSCLQRDLWVSITHRINKVYITIWHKNRVKPHATAVLSADQVMKRLHFRFIANLKISTWNSTFLQKTRKFEILNLFWFEIKFLFSGDLKLSAEILANLTFDGIYTTTLDELKLIKLSLVIYFWH